MAAGQRQLLRRARGFVPNPIRLADRSPQLLAVGAELKNTFCLVRDGWAFLSQHVGDLKDYRTYEYFAREIESWKALMRVAPEAVVCDLHPNYLSTRFAEKSGAPQLLGVQHHHAHVASVMAEHDLHGPVIGVALDGTGYGTDDTAWGGEFLVADRRDFERVAHFKRYPLPGGDKAVAEPWRMAVSVLLGEGLAATAARYTARHGEQELLVIKQMIDTGFNSPPTSSAGRLFDAVSALLELCRVTTYEAQAAIRLEAIVDSTVTDGYPVALESAVSPAVLNFGPAIRALLEDQSHGVAAGTIAARFHNAVAAAIVRVCEAAREQRGINVVALSGGVFQNAVLFTRTGAALQAQGFEVHTNTVVPPNDGGLALGQAAVAVARLEQRKNGGMEEWKNEAGRPSRLPTFHSSAEATPCA
jgi:hydrogenase maturation protein HypF